MGLIERLRFNAYFYWMVRYPWTHPLLMPLVRRHVPALATLSSLLVPFHRYVSLYPVRRPPRLVGGGEGRA